MSGVKAAAAGGNVSMAVLDDGDVHVWGGVAGCRYQRTPMLLTLGSQLLWALGLRCSAIAGRRDA